MAFIYSLKSLPRTASYMTLPVADFNADPSDHIHSVEVRMGQVLRRDGAHVNTDNLTLPDLDRMLQTHREALRVSKVGEMGGILIGKYLVEEFDDVGWWATSTGAVFLHCKTLDLYLDVFEACSMPLSNHPIAEHSWTFVNLLNYFQDVLAGRNGQLRPT